VIVLLVLITYDVSLIEGDGKTRLRKVSKLCQNYGQRVQNSVFECHIDAAQLASLKHQLIEAIDPNQDSLRFYRIGNQYKNKVEHIGVKKSLDMDATLIF